jgi:uncharacterized phiE125 gp8 family phage protein
MKVQLYSAPALEPISLDELKLHLKIDSGSFAENMDETQSISPGSHVAADNWTTHVGTAVAAMGYNTVVMFQSGANGAGGTVDVKIQECDTIGGTYTDWPTGAFAQVTEANDNATYEKAYTGTKAYIKTIAKILVAACEFGTTIIRLTATLVEDDLLTNNIKTAREMMEAFTHRKLITQTWDYYPEDFPRHNYLKIPFGNLQTITHVKYTDSDGDQTTMTAGTDYIVETNGDQCGAIVLPYGISWPSFTKYPSNPIVIRFVCGWTTAALVPYDLKSAMKLIAADSYVNRESQLYGMSGATYQQNKRLVDLYYSSILWDEF